MEFYSSLDASQLDSDTPTLFELISSSQLEALLLPSLRYILVHYTLKYPRYLIKINSSFDELNLLIRSFIEYYFLNYFQGTFTENFYGIKRVNNTKTPSKLSQLVPSLIEQRRSLLNLQLWVSLFEITGVSYLNEKLSHTYDLYYTKLITKQLELGLDSKENRKIKWKRRFILVFPYIQSTLKGLNLLTTLLYLSGNLKSPTLLSWIFNINFSRLNSYDYEKFEKKLIKKKKSTRPTSYKLFSLIFKTFFSPSWKLIKYILGTFFPFAIFSLKFLEWWNNSEFSHQLLKSQGNLIDFNLPSPANLLINLKKKSGEKPLKNYKSSKFCPICKKNITNPAIIETGYVFDYSCIYNYLQNSHKIVGQKLKNKQEKEDEDEQDEEDEQKELEQVSVYDVSKGGRCPITGKKLLGCKWNTIKEEWEIEGIRRLIF